METLPQEKNLYRAVAELAYTVSFADQDVSEDEVEAFFQVIQEVIGEGEVLARKHFNFINQSIHPKVEDSYRHAIQIIQKNKASLDRVLIRKFLHILERVAKVRGISEEEEVILNRFEEDVLQIHASKKSEYGLRMSPQIANLYSAVGELAYVMARTDQEMSQEEKDAFKRVIQMKLGAFDWLAAKRFDVLDSVIDLNVEVIYEHALYLIQKNAQALDEEMIEDFQKVMIEVAKVSGVSPEENELMRRFRQDIVQIYEESGKADE